MSGSNPFIIQKGKQAQRAGDWSKITDESYHPSQVRGTLTGNHSENSLPALFPAHIYQHGGWKAEPVFASSGPTLPRNLLVLVT